MAEKIAIELEVESSAAGTGVKNLKQQLREATEEAQALGQKFGNSSKEFIEAAKRAANIKDEIKGVAEAVDALHPEDKFNAITNVAGGIVGGFAAAQGAMALFGSESEDVQKALLKVQAAMALSQGLNQIIGLKGAFEALAIQIKGSTIFTKISTAAQATYNAVVGAGTGAMKLFRLAMAATGIGALVVGLGLLIANFDKVTAFVQKNSETLIKWGKIILGVLFPPVGVALLLWEGIKKLGERFDFVGAIITKVGDKFTFLKNKIVELLQSIGILSTAEEKSAEARMEQSKDREKAIKKEIELAKAQGVSAKELAALDVKLARERFLAYDQMYKARLAAGREISQEEKEQYSELSQALKIAKIQENKIIQDANAKQLEENKKKWAAKKEADKKAAEEALKLQTDLQDLIISNIQNERERELREIQISFERKIAAIRGNSATEVAIREQLAISQQNATAELNAKFSQEDAQAKLDAIQLEYENKNALLEAQRIQTELEGLETAAIEKEQADLAYQKDLEDESLTREQKLLSLANFEKAKSDIEKRESEQRLATQRQIEAAKFSLADSTVKGLGSLTEIFINNGKKQEKAAKALAVAQLAIDTAKAISSTIANATQAAAAGGPAAPVLAAVYIASGIATVLANVAQAKKLLGGAGSSASAAGASSGLSGAAGSEVAAPRLTSTDSPRTQLSAEERLNVTVKAQVVETEVTDSQKRVSGIKEAATF